jgi:hypothetical protein
VTDAGYRFAIGTLIAVAFIVIVVLIDGIGRQLGQGLAGILP